MIGQLRMSCLRSVRSARCAGLTHSFSPPGGGSAFQSSGGASRSYSSRFQNTKKRRVEVLEREPEAPQQSVFGSQQQQAQQGFSQAPSASSMPSYMDQKEREQQQGTQWDALTQGTVAHMRKVYGTLATGIGIAAGASLFTMATPLVAVHPLIPSLAAVVPLMGLYYTNKHTHSETMRVGLFAAFTGLSGVAMAPLLKFALAVSPMVVPQALLITTGLFGTMTALSMFAKPGATLRWGVPLAGGMVVLMMAGLGAMFVPVTSAWYPLLHSVQLYGGLGAPPDLPALRRSPSPHTPPYTRAPATAPAPTPTVRPHHGAIARRAQVSSRCTLRTTRRR